MHSKIVSELYRQAAIKSFLNRSENKDIFKNNLNKKVKIDTGKFCNASCNFCYYYDSLKIKDLIDLKHIQSKPIKELIDKGIEQFEFSGGEPTLNTNLADIMEYILTLDSKIKFGIVTNGWRLKYFIKKLEEMKLIDSLNSVLISLHGGEVVHDGITNLKGSYKKIIEVINYIKTYHPNILIRINIVLINQELDSRFINIIKEYINRNIQINLLPQNYWMDASKFNEKKDTNVLKILDSLDYNNLIAKNNFYRTIYGANILNIRYYQLCKLPTKFHPFIINHFGHFFDKLDWNKIFYPNEDLKLPKPKDINRLNNFNLDNKLNRSSVEKVYVKDAELSTLVDGICNKCIEFKTLKCDGLKYTNQTEEILNETKEEYFNRKEYARKNQ